MALLREAVGDGRLDLTELDERLGTAYAARTRGDLAAVTRDLRPRAGAAAPERHRTVGGRLARTGVWDVPPRLAVTAVLGSVVLDLRHARISTREVQLTCRVVLGGIEIVVGPEVRVVIEGSGVLGGFRGPTGLVAEQVDDRSPTLRVGGRAVGGGVTVERRHR